MDQEKDDSPESILIKKMVEDAIYTRHHITYEDDEEIKKWKNRLHEQNHTNVSCLRRCPRLPARTQLVLPSFHPMRAYPKKHEHRFLLRYLVLNCRKRSVGFKWNSIFIFNIINRLTHTQIYSHLISIFCVPRDF